MFPAPMPGARSRTAVPGGLALASAAIAAALAACGPRAPGAVAPPLGPPLDVSPVDAPVAWSPDGAALAVVRPDGVHLVDVARGTSRRVSGPGAIAVDWAPARALLVVERDAAGGRAVEVAPETGARRVLHEDPALAGARWLHGGAGWAAVAQAVEVRSYGAQAKVSLAFGLGAAPAAPFRWEATIPARDPSADPGFGWRVARPNPVDHGLLLPQYRKDPMFPPHVRLALLDPFHPEPRPAGRIEGPGLSAAASWAPDGRRAAIASADGALHVLSGDGALARAPGPARGLRPAWHPAADAIFLGGWLVDPAGTPLRRLVSNAPGSLGEWSPTGDRLAVVAGGRLLLFGDLALPAPPPEAERRRARAREALWELGTLRAEQLVAPAVYLERRDRLRTLPPEPR